MASFFFFGFQKLGLQSVVGTMAADLSFTDACWLCPCEARVTACSHYIWHYSIWLNFVNSDCLNPLNLCENYKVTMQTLLEARKNQAIIVAALQTTFEQFLRLVRDALSHVKLITWS
jgi:hypothetical protein